MKRFLILFILIVFASVSCAGPNKMEWTEPDWHWDQFEKDREDCIQSVKKAPEQMKTVEDCLVKKGDVLEPLNPEEKEAITVGRVLEKAVTVPLSVLILALVI